MSTKISNIEEYHIQYKKSVEDPEKFWSEIANEFVWKKKWNKVLNWNFPEARVEWFIDGKVNITENCIDRHLETQGNATAIIWEPNNPKESSISISYNQLYARVCKFSNAMLNLGIKKGDIVCLYMPMVPELAIAVLACARIGAIHSVIFAGFSAKSLAERINDAGAKLIITTDGGYRGEKVLPIKSVVDQALENCPTVKKVVVSKRNNDNVSMVEGRDIWWEDAEEGMDDSNIAQEMDSEDPLFVLYTSGSTGKPKGVVHTTGGYMVFIHYTFQNVFQYKAGEVFWCTADVGWITGHSYLIYGPLLTGATTVMFEGIPTYPDPGRFWNIIDKFKVNIFYTAPTAIRALEAFGTEPLKPYKLDSLRVLGSVGEPINLEAWEWYDENVGKGKCPIVDTWWQTETGGILISPLAGITKTKPSYATLPLPGIQPVIVDPDGKLLEGNNVEGNLCIKFPWPGIIRTTYGDHERCKKSYFSTYPNLYFTGDGCKRDHDGYYRILGRVDDVINVSGHRIGTAEVENAINEHDLVIESAVVAFPHEIKGQGIYAFVIVTKKISDIEFLNKDIIAKVTEIIGPIAKPDTILIVEDLPKTRSGKIMRRILRKLVENDFNNLGDISTLVDPSVVEKIKEGMDNLKNQKPAQN